MAKRRRLFSSCFLLGETLLAVGLISILSLHQKIIKDNLEKNSLICPLSNNTYLWDLDNNYRFKNIDIDYNGKYESVILYKDSVGNTLCQEVKKLEGKLILDEPKLLKK